MAKSVKALITPEVLKWARERRIRLEIDHAAKKLKIEPECLEAWENGTEQPTIAQLKKIAKLYRTHISIFYLQKPPTDFQPLTDYRVLPEQFAIDTEQVYRLNANIIEAYERREVLIELYELLEEVPPEVTLDIDRHESPVQIAEKIREFLELNRSQLREANDPYAALKFWKQTVETKGILVCQTSVNTHLSVELATARGFCIAQRPFPVIVVNPKDSPYGRIFTLIHELVHIALGESVIQNTGFEAANSPNLDPIEVFCNQVAAEVLVPKNELLKKINLETLQEDLTGTSKFFHVSPEVIMRRLLTLEIISRRNYQTYRSQQLAKYRDAPRRSGGAVPYPNRLLNTSGEHFARTAFTAYYEQKITRAELASVLSNSDTKHLAKIESAIFV
ncbi:MAG: XRE family transcriptional regulator [Candidatus Poribacteria bacterium]|nr:XRE family transcriptional regulator [Candidatus Poribacteria bacterium]